MISLTGTCAIMSHVIQQQTMTTLKDHNQNEVGPHSPQKLKEWQVCKFADNLQT